MFFYKSNLKVVSLCLFLLIPFCSIFGINSVKNTNCNNRIEQQSLNKKLGRKIKKLKKKIQKVEEKVKEGRKGSVLLFASILFLILGIMSIISAGGAGLIGILWLMIGIPLTIGGLVLLIIYFAKG